MPARQSAWSSTRTCKLLASTLSIPRCSSCRTCTGVGMSRSLALRRWFPTSRYHADVRVTLARFNLAQTFCPRQLHQLRTLSARLPQSLSSELRSIIFSDATCTVSIRLTSAFGLTRTSGAVCFLAAMKGIADLTVKLAAAQHRLSRAASHCFSGP